MILYSLLLLMIIFLVTYKYEIRKICYWRKNKKKRKKRKIYKEHKLFKLCSTTLWICPKEYYGGRVIILLLFFFCWMIDGIEIENYNFFFVMNFYYFHLIFIEDAKDGSRKSHDKFIQCNNMENHVQNHVPISYFVIFYLFFCCNFPLFLVLMNLFPLEFLVLQNTKAKITGKKRIVICSM